MDNVQMWVLMTFCAIVGALIGAFFVPIGQVVVAVVLVGMMNSSIPDRFPVYGLEICLANLAVVMWMLVTDGICFLNAH